MQTSPRLSLVTSYRQRPEYLDLLLARLTGIREREGFTAFELIVVEGDAQPTVAHLADKYEWVQYLYVPHSGTFNRPLLTNRGAAIAKGDYMMAFDVDLLPGEDVLSNHLALAMSSPRIVVGGYRLQLPEMLREPVIPDINSLVAKSAAQKKALVCPEDSHGALIKYLLCGEKPGVVACYPTSTFIAIGGMDEEFAGWGPDDQNLMERLCDTGLALVRCYDLLYYHLPHEYENQWHEREFVEANRAKFDQKRRASKNEVVQ